MNKIKIPVTVVLQINEEINILPFEKYLKKEGFEKVDEFAYFGEGSTPVMHLKAFIFSVFKEAFKIGNVKSSKLIYQIGENPLEAYKYKECEFLEEKNI